MNRCAILCSEITKNSNEELDEYLQRLYAAFQNDFINNKIFFKGKEIKYRDEPRTHGNYEETFIHITHGDRKNMGFENREIDYSRSGKIQWVRRIIDNYPCKDPCCNGIKIWKNDKKTHFLCEKERYIVIIEERKNYYLFVTAFHLYRSYELKDKLKDYELYKNNPI